MDNFNIENAFDNLPVVIETNATETNYEIVLISFGKALTSLCKARIGLRAKCDDVVANMNENNYQEAKKTTASFNNLAKEIKNIVYDKTGLVIFRDFQKQFDNEITDIKKEIQQYAEITKKASDVFVDKRIAKVKEILISKLDIQYKILDIHKEFQNVIIDDLLKASNLKLGYDVYVDTDTILELNKRVAQCKAFQVIVQERLNNLSKLNQKYDIKEVITQKDIVNFYKEPLNDVYETKITALFECRKQEQIKVECQINDAVKKALSEVKINPIIDKPIETTKSHGFCKHKCGFIAVHFCDFECYDNKVSVPSPNPYNDINQLQYHCKEYKKMLDSCGKTPLTYNLDPKPIIQKIKYLELIIEEMETTNINIVLF